MPNAGVDGPPRYPWLRAIGLWLAYAVLYSAAHAVAHFWAGKYIYSLCYPAAGVRLAFLWRYGARWTPAVIVAELPIQLFVMGVSGLHHGGLLGEIIALCRAPMVTGAAVALERWINRRGLSDMASGPMALGVVAVLAPTAIAFLTGAMEWLRPNPPKVSSFSTITVFLVGDMLGILLVTPPLLWLVGWLESHWLLPRGEPDGGSADQALPRPGRWRVVEAGLVLAFGWYCAKRLIEVNPDLCVLPVLLTTSWIGLRTGRGGAWVATAIPSLFVVFWSIGRLDTSLGLSLHMGMAATGVSAFLAGSFADAQAEARAALARRDRILYQAERLKTLRAMSLAVLHEISQPLSTLAIESRYLAEVSGDAEHHAAEIIASANLIARKADRLATMIRRLRRFGGRAADKPAMLPLTHLLSDISRMATIESQQGEAGHRGPGIKLGLPNAEFFVMGQDVELTQALLNLLRNALAASPRDETVHLVLRGDASEALIRIVNRVTLGSVQADDPASQDPERRGMGVGRIIAQAIIEAHGGRLTHFRDDHGRIVHEVNLPLVEGKDTQ